MKSRFVAASSLKGAQTILGRIREKVSQSFEIIAPSNPAH